MRIVTRVTEKRSASARSGGSRSPAGISPETIASRRMRVHRSTAEGAMGAFSGGLSARTLSMIGRTNWYHQFGRRQGRARMPGEWAWATIPPPWTIAPRQTRAPWSTRSCAGLGFVATVPAFDVRETITPDALGLRAATRAEGRPGKERARARGRRDRASAAIDVAEADTPGARRRRLRGQRPPRRRRDGTRSLGAPALAGPRRRDQGAARGRRHATRERDAPRRGAGDRARSSTRASSPSTRSAPTPRVAPSSS